ncbi:hypothetical protein G9A89_003310 [Geosiphon pyriformis]|nr:hypothetical protein G9A89_003310 [Geosiphon pyriformis]
MSVVSGLDSVMVLNSVPVFSTPFPPVVNNAAANLSSSSFKVLTTKVGGLESKMVALKVLVKSVLEKLDCLESDYLGSGVAIIMDISLAKHVYKVSEVSGWLLSLKLLFKDKLFVSILGLYAGASSVVQFSQAGNVNFMIARAINEFSFVVLDDDFNENGSRRSASFKKCLDLGLINSLNGCSYVKEPTWANSHGVAKTINFLFISSNLANAVMGCNVFDAISVSVGLGGLLDTWLNSVCKQTNRDQWKFDFKSATEAKWKEFGIVISANAVMFSNEFATSVKFSDLDVMWDVVHKIVILLANEVFKKKWFKSFDDVFTKDSFRYHKLELLVSKIVKTSCKGCVANFDSLMKCWVFLNNVRALAVQVIVDSGADSGHVCSAFFGARRAYHTSKLTESLRAKEAAIRAAIDKRMESFEVNKNHTIRSVLERPFRKVVLDHLVVGDKLILKPDLVKSKINVIMEGWTRKCQMVDDVSEAWISIILKPYEWEGVLTNTRPIALIETACKILSKILSDRISSICSTFNVFRGDNFLVLKGTMIQSPIFVISSVIEDALEKNRKLCHADSKTGLTFFFAAGTFINDTIWVGSSQSATQYIFDIASEFFQINDISINNDKTVAIPINNRISNSSLFINNSSISIARKGESHQYLGMVHILLDCNLSLSGLLANFFWFHDEVSMLVVLVLHSWINLMIIMKRLDSRGPVLKWFKLSAAFFNDASLSLTCFLAVCSNSSLDILGSNDFMSVCDQLSRIDNSVLSVYMDGSMKDLGTVSCRASAAAFFEDIGLGLGVGISGLMFSILAELQVIALALECAPLSSTIYLFLDSQSALDACKSELGLVCSDFHNQCWVEHQHIVNVIHDKNLKVSWHKVKDHSGCLPPRLDEHFIVTDYGVVSDNSRHFVLDIYQSICHAHWEVSSGSKFLEDGLWSDVDWVHSSLVWHSDLHMAASFTSQFSANAHMYFIKALYHHLPVVIRKHLYRRLYPSVLCLYCNDMEVSDHAFFYRVDESACRQLLDSYLLSFCTSGSSVSAAFFKGFVFDNWFREAVSIFHNPKVAGMEVVKFVHFLSMAFRDNIWLVRAKHCTYMERNSLISLDSSVPILVSGLASGLFVGVLKLLGITNAFGMHFGFRKSCSFFSGVDNPVSVHIAM